MWERIFFVRELSENKFQVAGVFKWSTEENWTPYISESLAGFFAGHKTRKVSKNRINVYGTWDKIANICRTEGKVIRID